MLMAMRALVIAIAIFGLLAFDLAENDGEWTEDAAAFVRQLHSEIQNVLRA
jgi:hypothetical protein